jgi:hypothetical protein
MKDADFLADAERMRVSLAPLPGDELQAIIEKSVAYSPAIVEKANALIQSAELNR